ncbi:hypothetical protein C2G38_2241521 [Gigaspora rosea]|uniref:Uncharacterized protein n=1 Tax=Gigaspora rosea TaxID=44941 RepID=A0A397VRT4_9GLOM|nr:hypothetical protein C2G38_2241521 [Gigaspora rosea]
MSLEQQLCIRVILRNGTVKEIDPDLKLDPINYCLLNNTNTKYEIKKNNNIIVYLKDKNNNTSILRNIVNPISIYPLQKPFILVTYVNATNSTDSSDPTSYIDGELSLIGTEKLEGKTIFYVINIDDSGNLTVMSTTVAYGLDPPVTIVSTLNNGYLAFYNDTINNNDNNSLLPCGGEIDNLPNVTGLSHKGWRAKTMPFGVLFLQITFGANVIMDNNTFLLASQYTTNNASWSLLTIQLPNDSDAGYDNLFIKETFPSINANVSSSTTTLNIILIIDVILSAGNITIYKVSDNSVRQRVSATMNEFCKLDYKVNSYVIVKSLIAHSTSMANNIL